MSKKINKGQSSPYKTEIEKEFNSYEPNNNGFISINQLNDYTKINNLKKKHPFIYESIKSITSQKNEEKNEHISTEEYLDFFDEQLNDINSKEGLKNIFNVLADGDDKNLSWNKLPIIAKELGDNNTANNLMKLIEQGKLYNKDINFDKFCDIMNDDNDDKNIKSLNVSDDSEEQIKNKNKKNKINNKEESEDMGTITSKNEDTKNSIDNNDGEKSNKRYHRRYRDTKNKNENKDNGNNTNNNNKIHTKYRKKK